MILDNTRKTWFNVFIDGKHVGGFADMTEQVAWDRAQVKYKDRGIIKLVELDPKIVAVLNDKLSNVKKKILEEGLYKKEEE